MTARDNAETADLTLEVGSLRGQLKESEGKCRALTVESEGWARQTAEATALLERIREATEDCDENDIDEARQCVVDVFHMTAPEKVMRLSRAPAQPAATTPVPMHLECPGCKLVHVDTIDAATGIDWGKRPHKTHLCLGCGALWKPAEFPTVGVSAAPEPGPARYPGDWSDATVGADGKITFPEQQPAAPEPSAENESPECDNCQAVIDGDQAATSDVCFDCWRSAKERAESAEAQLAAVNEVAQRAEKRVELYPGLKGSTYYAAYLEILALLVRGATPAPSPGAGFKARVERVADSADDVDVFCTADPGRSGK